LTSQRRLVGMDTDVTIAILKAGLTHVLGCMTAFQFVITETNQAEVTHAPESTDLVYAISRGDVSVVPLVDIGALSVFARLNRLVDAGEAAIIALVHQLGGDVAMHDRAGRRQAAALISEERVYRLEDILVEAVRSDCITVVDADAATATLVQASDYRTSFSSSGIEFAVADAALGLHRKRSKV
jgi:predicted nucleic acid-binding protein